jgi:hypothetical protein
MRTFRAAVLADSSKSRHWSETGGDQMDVRRSQLEARIS